MATTAFICDLEDSEKFEASQQLKQRGCSYTLLQVLVGTLVVFMLTMTGGIVWLMLSQNCSEKVWTVRFTGNNINFTSPETEKYMIFGMVFMGKPSSETCPTKTFKLLQRSQYNPKQGGEITKANLNEVFFKDANLKEGDELRIQLNCNSLEIDEAKSILVVYQKSCYWPLMRTNQLYSRYPAQVNKPSLYVRDSQAASK